VAEARSRVYYHDAATRQLRVYDGYQTDVPLVDNVVELGFEYFGSPAPPVRPKPPAGESNCLYDAAGLNVSGLPTLAAQGGSLAPLALSLLEDGPWCGHDQNRYDADLLRVRRVRVTLRVQASRSEFRGTGTDFKVPGGNANGLSRLPDYTVTFDVSPRNLNLHR
jgi:hypothetical protein